MVSLSAAVLSRTIPSSPAISDPRLVSPLQSAGPSSCGALSTLCEYPLHPSAVLLDLCHPAVIRPSPGAPTRTRRFDTYSRDCQEVCLWGLHTVLVPIIAIHNACALMTYCPPHDSERVCYPSDMHTEDCDKALSLSELVMSISMPFPAIRKNAAAAFVQRQTFRDDRRVPESVGDEISFVAVQHVVIEIR